MLCGIIAAWLTDRVTDQCHTLRLRKGKMNQYKRLLGNTFIFAIGTFSSKILVILMLRFTGMMTQDEMGVADLIIKDLSILYRWCRCPSDRRSSATDLSASITSAVCCLPLRL